MRERTARLKLIRATAEGEVVCMRMIKALRAKGLTVYIDDTEAKGTGRWLYEIRVPVDQMAAAESVLLGWEW